MNATQFGSAILIVTSALYIVAQALGWRKYSILTIFFPEDHTNNSVLKAIFIVAALIMFGSGVLLFAHS